MLNNFSFHVYAENSLFIVENCNVFFGTSSAPYSVYTVRFGGRFWTKVSQSNLCVKKNVVNNTPFFCNKMDKKSPKVILLLQNSEPFLFGCQLIKSPKVILLLHNSEPLLSGCQLISSPALSLKLFSIQSVNFRT